jgi:AraC-like DNA-binding protein
MPFQNKLISFKIKTDFRLVYGTSLLQYNIDKKMNLAMQLILNTDMQIKNTLEVGYESHSKFSAAFKRSLESYLQKSVQSMR